MSEKYKGKYRIPLSRMKNWDYSWDASYFVTICIQDRGFYFGDVVKGEMILSEIGEIAKRYWLEIPVKFPHAELNEFMVMPNHIHGIIVINKMDRDAINRVCTGVNNNQIGRGQGGVTGKKNPMLSDGLSKVIRWFKGRVAFEARKIDPTFVWQARFHDHIIRNDEAFQRVKEYIFNNPLAWDEDKYNQPK